MSAIIIWQVPDSLFNSFIQYFQVPDSLFNRFIQSIQVPDSLFNSFIQSFEIPDSVFNISFSLLRLDSLFNGVGNFRQKNNSAEDGIDGTNGYFRLNSGCSAEQKTLGIPFRTLPRKRKQLGIPFLPFSSSYIFCICLPLPSYSVFNNCPPPYSVFIYTSLIFCIYLYCLPSYSVFNYCPP